MHLFAARLIATRAPVGFYFEHKLSDLPATVGDEWFLCEYKEITEACSMYFGEGESWQMGVAEPSVQIERKIGDSGRLTKAEEDWDIMVKANFWLPGLSSFLGYEDVNGWTPLSTIELDPEDRAFFEEHGMMPPPAS
jgi:hypothetical protein